MDSPWSQMACGANEFDRHFTLVVSNIADESHGPEGS